ncbi:MAG: hypothetical protein WBN72_03940 [Nitrososphaeraceae archaeon]
MRKKESTSRKRSNIDTALSARTKKQIDSLPEHAQHIFKYMPTRMTLSRSS